MFAAIRNRVAPRAPAALRQATRKYGGEAEHYAGHPGDGMGGAQVNI